MYQIFYKLLIGTVSPVNCSREYISSFELNGIYFTCKPRFQNIFCKIIFKISKKSISGRNGEGCDDVDGSGDVDNFCEQSVYGCCPDNVTPAEGPNNKGCTKVTTPKPEPEPGTTGMFIYTISDGYL